MKASCRHTITVTIVAITTVLLAACGSMSRLETGEAVAYKEAEIRAPLEVPEGMNQVPLNPANEIQQISIEEQANDQRVPPSAGLVEQNQEEFVAESTTVAQEESQLSTEEPILTVVITGRDARLNTEHPVHIVWQTIGLSLQRLAIPVSDRDRSGGIYFVDCLAASGEEIKEKRWWNVFSKDDASASPVCELSIVEESDNIAVRVSPSPEGVPTEQEMADLFNEFKFDLDRV